MGKCRMGKVRIGVYWEAVRVCTCSTAFAHLRSPSLTFAHLRSPSLTISQVRVYMLDGLHKQQDELVRTAVTHHTMGDGGANYTKDLEDAASGSEAKGGEGTTRAALPAVAAEVAAVSAASSELAESDTTSTRRSRTASL